VAGIERVLIVCPTSLKHQWKQEIEKFCDRSAVVVEGTLAGRSNLYAADSFYKITKYDVIHRDADPIRKWGPDIVILDEAQRIKNWKTRRAQSMRMSCNSTYLLDRKTDFGFKADELLSVLKESFERPADKAVLPQQPQRGPVRRAEDPDRHRPRTEDTDR